MPLAVVTPDHDAALAVRLVAGIAEGWVVGVGLVHQVAAAERLDLLLQAQQHDVAVAVVERIVAVVVTGLLAALDVVVGAA